VICLHAPVDSLTLVAYFRKGGCIYQDEVDDEINFFIVLLLLLDYCLGLSHHTHFLEARTTLFEQFNDKKKAKQSKPSCYFKVVFFLVSQGYF
jgi:hypothetical protein